MWCHRNFTTCKRQVKIIAFMPGSRERCPARKHVHAIPEVSVRMFTVIWCATKSAVTSHNTSKFNDVYETWQALEIGGWYTKHSQEPYLPHKSFCES